MNVRVGRNHNDTRTLWDRITETTTDLHKRVSRGDSFNNVQQRQKNRKSTCTSGGTLKPTKKRK